MKTKRPYTTITVPLKLAANKEGKTWQEMRDEIPLMYQERVTALPSPTTNDELEVLMTLLYLDIPILEGKAKHIFLTDIDFCNWLVNCVKDLEPDHAKVIEEYIDNAVGVLHFPTGLGKRSIAFLIPQEILVSDGSVGRYNQLLMSFSVQKEGDESHHRVAMLPDANNSQVSKEAMWYAKLIVGLGMYLSCFPETILDGIPQDVKHPAWHDYKNASTIRISPRVTIGNGTSPSPHYRIGHFRFLQSEKFVHKRFQTVFVEGAFVKGIAESVNSPEELQEAI